MEYEDFLLTESATTASMFESDWRMEEEEMKAFNEWCYQHEKELIEEEVMVYE